MGLDTPLMTLVLWRLADKGYVMALGVSVERGVIWRITDALIFVENNLGSS